MRFPMERNMISEGIFKQAVLHPDKPAIMGIDGNGVDYADTVKLYKETRAFLAGVPVDSTDRIVIWVGDAIVFGILSLAVMEHAALVPLDPEMSEEQHNFFFELLHVDYIITDHESQAVKIAEQTGIGLIRFNYTGGFGSISCSFEL
jgi:long-subunit acyl-CoA synthetase (AMP-forming)